MVLIRRYYKVVLIPYALAIFSTSVFCKDNLVNVPITFISSYVTAGIIPLVARISSLLQSGIDMANLLIMPEQIVISTLHTIASLFGLFCFMNLWNKINIDETEMRNITFLLIISTAICLITKIMSPNFVTLSFIPLYTILVNKFQLQYNKKIIIACLVVVITLLSLLGSTLMIYLAISVVFLFLVIRNTSKSSTKYSNISLTEMIDYKGDILRSSKDRGVTTQLAHRTNSQLKSNKKVIELDF